MANAKKSTQDIERKKQLAFTLYVDNGFEQKVIAQVTGISEVSISKWKKAGDWEEERRIAMMGPEKSMRRLIKTLDAMISQIEGREVPSNVPTSKEADIISKVSDAIKKLRSENTMFVRSEVGKQFITHIQTVYGQQRAIEILDYWHDFLMANKS